MEAWWRESFEEEPPPTSTVSHKTLRRTWDVPCGWSAVQIHTRKAKSPYLGSIILSETNTETHTWSRRSWKGKRWCSIGVQTPVSFCLLLRLFNCLSFFCLHSTRRSSTTCTRICYFTKSSAKVGNKPFLDRYTGIQEAPRCLTIEYVVHDLMGNKKLERRLFASNDVKNDGRDTSKATTILQSGMNTVLFLEIQGERGGIRGGYLRKAICRPWDKSFLDDTGKLSSLKEIVQVHMSERKERQRSCIQQVLSVKPLQSPTSRKDQSWWGRIFKQTASKASFHSLSSGSSNATPSSSLLVHTAELRFTTYCWRTTSRKFQACSRCGSSLSRYRDHQSRRWWYMIKDTPWEPLWSAWATTSSQFTRERDVGWLNVVQHLERLTRYRTLTHTPCRGSRSSGREKERRLFEDREPRHAQSSQNHFWSGSLVWILPREARGVIISKRFEGSFWSAPGKNNQEQRITWCRRRKSIIAKHSLRSPNPPILSTTLPFCLLSYASYGYQLFEHFSAIRSQEDLEWNHHTLSPPADLLVSNKRHEIWWSICRLKADGGLRLGESA